MSPRTADVLAKTRCALFEIQEPTYSDMYSFADDAFGVDNEQRQLRVAGVVRQCRIEVVQYGFVSDLGCCRIGIGHRGFRHGLAQEVYLRLELIAFFLSHDPVWEHIRQDAGNLVEVVVAITRLPTPRKRQTNCRFEVGNGTHQHGLLIHRRVELVPQRHVGTVGVAQALRGGTRLVGLFHIVFREQDRKLLQMSPLAVDPGLVILGLRGFRVSHTLQRLTNRARKIVVPSGAISRAQLPNEHHRFDVVQPIRGQRFEHLQLHVEL
ncbi:methylase involved in ubiquinone menaquinone biosynthesis protein, putative [Babesia ovata]|uniref:Methylase involved in ubiquinone menaquinone biosynthesis protein, putative n=1 Tax=Babesia ovata TaxID=189622 RepID=A0A2H6KIE9_9APIC|nr:methylase involved in ubiquinone menaquinone biosynthesis protein, putative [Babesia ovata]GBE62768.1 methylase involved in ubiquinone menaquinone biosynthesis protein, putative [Babesia ovata]